MEYANEVNCNGLRIDSGAVTVVHVRDFQPWYEPPIPLSEREGITPERFEELGVFDPWVNVDSNFSIDPILMAHIDRDVLGRGTFEAIVGRIGNALTMLSNNDRGWSRILSFDEFTPIALGVSHAKRNGYREESDLNSALEQNFTLMQRRGIASPVGALILPLFMGRGVGADRISDFAANLCPDAFSAYTQQMAQQLGIECPLCPVKVAGRHTMFPAIRVRDGLPLMLVPTDIMRLMPMRFDQVQREDENINAALRGRINQLVRIMTQGRREPARNLVEAFLDCIDDEVLNELIQRHTPERHAAEPDMLGMINSRYLFREFAFRYPIPGFTDRESPRAVLDYIFRNSAAVFGGVASEEIGGLHFQRKRGIIRHMVLSIVDSHLRRHAHGYEVRQSKDNNDFVVFNGNAIASTFHVHLSQPDRTFSAAVRRVAAHSAELGVRCYALAVNPSERTDGEMQRLIARAELPGEVHLASVQI